VLRQVAEGVLIHQSELLQNNAVVVQGRAGVLLIDPGIRGSEMVCLANDLRELGQPVVAGFSTYPDWDHRALPTLLNNGQHITPGNGGGPCEAGSGLPRLVACVPLSREGAAVPWRA
jgi:hypothetical protein